ncbi:class I adenylate-forming enzyme family protein [Haloglomus litoreum]|uniref:class I adenylate-forming enzyme family protein n=1 Tax=Haloglomus litoreum TaxID=3034026 RepID=UPI0023E7BB41|nr:AMP-binding protein [Haloglomus sp. DT116]
MNFAHHVRQAARDRPGRTALTDPGRSVTFAELDAETDAFANALAELGVDPGDRVALYLPNSISFVAAYFGTMKRGAIPFPINLRFEGEEISYVLEDGGARVVVTAGPFEDAIADLDAGSVEELVVAGGDRGRDYASLVEQHAGHHEVHPRKEAELADIMYTSGTTGRPKGVRHTHQNLSTNARAILTRMEWSANDVGLTVNPCFHVAGLHVTVSPFLVSGTTNHLLADWDPATALSTVEEHGVTTSFCIATIIVDLVNFEDAASYDTSTLSVVGCGGSPMPKERISTFEERYDATLVEGYGMTETTPAAALNHPGEDAVRKPGSIGTVIADVVDVRIEDPESGEPVQRGELGELLWHGDTVTPGYYNLPEENEAAFVQREGKRWLRSGDIARMDEDGHLFIEDRIDDMLITGGENVYPREVEDVLYLLDGVAEAAVFGTPHERLGEQVTAAIVRDDDALDDDTVERHCREHLAGFKIPRRIQFVDAMPRTSTRKIDKVALRERLE